MTKKNIRSQEAAPVQRETTVTSSLGEKGAIALRPLEEMEMLSVVGGGGARGVGLE